MAEGESPGGKGSSSGWTPERSAAGDRNPWFLTSVISLATFMVVLDTSIANVSLPNIAGGLSVSIREATWILTSFLVATAIVIPISGWLSDVIGRKRYYMISVGTFSFASLMCALAPNLPFLVVARIIQGMAGGGLAPSEQSMLADSFPPEQRGMAFAAYAFVVVVAPILGPTIGGYITDTISWHWIFLINVPTGIVSLLLVNHFVVEPEIMEKERRERLRKGVSVDWIGFILVALGLGCLTVMLERGQDDGWFSSSFITVMAITAVVSLVALVVWELNHKDPIVRLGLLRHRHFAIVTGLIFCLGIILFGTTQVIPQMFQEVFQYTAFRAGLALTLGGVGIILMMPLAGRLAGNVDGRFLIMPAFIVIAFGLWHFTTLSLQSDFMDLAIARLFQTFTLPFAFVTINTIAYADLKPWETTDASALINVFRNIGGSVGISLSQTVLARSTQTYQAHISSRITFLNANLTDALQNLSLGPVGIQAKLGIIYSEVMREARFLAYLEVYRTIAVIVLIVTPFVLFLRTPSSGAGGGGNSAEGLG